MQLVAPADSPGAASEDWCSHGSTWCMCGRVCLALLCLFLSSVPLERYLFKQTLLQIMNWLTFGHVQMVLRTSQTTKSPWWLLSSARKVKALRTVWMGTPGCVPARFPALKWDWLRPVSCGSVVSLSCLWVSVSGQFPEVTSANGIVSFTAAALILTDSDGREQMEQDAKAAQFLHLAHSPQSDSKSGKFTFETRLWNQAFP